VLIFFFEASVTPAFGTRFEYAVPDPALQEFPDSEKLQVIDVARGPQISLLFG
jgi:hypothetical protein